MRLFKYVHSDRVDVLENRMICFSTPQNLNDPFELKPHIRDVATEEVYDKCIRLEVEKTRAEYLKLPRQFRRRTTFEAFAESVCEFTHKGLTNGVKADLARRAQKILEGQFDKGIGILSLTENFDNLLMWAHYADSHQGFVIEFDPNSSFFNQKRNSSDEFGYLRQVKYSELRPSLILGEIVDFSPFITKGKVWEFECEWRMMLPIYMREKELASGHNLFSFPASAIKSIVFGCRSTDLTKEAVKKIIKGSSEFAHVEIMSSIIDVEHYKVNILKGGD